MSHWNLPAPPGFRGLDPGFPVTLYERHLPHWRQEGATYAVTFRQADSLPRVRIDELRRMRMDWEDRNPPPRSEETWRTYALEYTRRVNSWLDEGAGSCAFRSRENSEILADALTKFHGLRYHTGAFAIMPNHCHLVIRPFPGEKLEQLLKGMKGSVSRAIKLQQGQESASFWAQESHDRIIRDEEHLARVVVYTGANPAKAGFPHEREWRCWVAPDWVAAGWHFDAF
jgi:REP element-mobilizing transposase RayT